VFPFCLSRYIKALFGVVALCIVCVETYAVETEPSAEKILARLTYAMRTENYRGVFTYEHGGSLETIDVSHAVVNNIENERYILLNGPTRTLNRDGRTASCESLGGRMVRGAMLATGSGKALHFNEYYHLYYKGYDRVAGRKVAVVQLLPKDNDRYGMSLGVDVESGVLLKVLVVSRSKVLERMQFVAFDHNPEWDSEELESFTSVEPDQPCVEVATERKSAEAGASAGVDKWMPSWVPVGFTRANSRWTEQDGLVHTYTDGLSSFSVFVNPELVPENEDVQQIPRGMAQRGATLILMDLRRAEEQVVHLSLVGEVPETAAVRILQSISTPLLTPVP